MAKAKSILIEGTNLNNEKAFLVRLGAEKDNNTGRRRVEFTNAMNDATIPFSMVTAQASVLRIGLEECEETRGAPLGLVAVELLKKYTIGVNWAEVTP